MIGLYARVSTSQQNLDRQLQSISDYAVDELQADTPELAIYRDKSTGTDTDRSGYTDLMHDVEAGDLQAVVVHEISRLSRSLQDLSRTVERVTDAGAELHFVRDSLTFGPDTDPMTRLQMQMLGAFAEWEARVKQMNTKEGIAARRDADDEYHHGRPPLGFEKSDGHLHQGARYHDVVATLELVDRGEVSKRQAAKELECARPTITRALERRELYGLE
jgi:DNA invertase Pin-like site-specific DNA recombinase